MTRLLTVIALSVLVVRPSAQSRPPVIWEPTGSVVTWRGISFIVPAGLRGTDQGNAYDMSGSGIRGAGLGQCSLVIMPPVAAAASAARQAHEILAAKLATFGAAVSDARGGPDLTTELRVGYSDDGWSYVELNGMLREGFGNRARIMLIRLGRTVVPIIGVASQGNGCVGLMTETTANSNTITWLALFYSLRVAGATPTTHLRDQIVGNWSALSASVGAGIGASQEETYAPNGRYGRGTVAVGAGYEKGFAGDGSYLVEGHRLTTVPDRGAPQTTFARIVAEREGTTPPRDTTQLCTIIVVQGGAYERCLLRSN